MQLADITTRLHTELPLTRSIGMTVTSWDGKTVSLSAPLAPNLNHTDTAFGGSISCMGILAGYALVYLLLHERNISTKLLIQKSTTDYLRPIDTDFISTASLPDAPLIEEFFDALQKKRRARMTLESIILCRNVPSAAHTGLYVAMLY